MNRRWVLGLLAAVIFCVASVGASGKVLGTYYFPDKPFPEFMPLWQEGWQFKDANGDTLVYAKPDMPLGGYMFVHFRNTSTNPAKVLDLTIEGLKMSEALAKTLDGVGELEGHSILVSKLPKEQIELLKDAGHPVWWKAEPIDVKPGGMGQIVIRMRRDPKIANVNLTIETTEEVLKCSVPVKKVQPRFAGIYFSPDLRTVYLYPDHVKPGMKPQTILMDGEDITSQCEIAADKSLNISPILVKLARPLDLMSYHCWQAVYADKSSAMAGIMAWGNEFVYGQWGSHGEAKAFYEKMARHNQNAHMGHAEGPVVEMSLTPSGLEFLTKLGIRNMATWYGNARNTLFYFLQDEPDAQDPGIDDLPPDQRLGLVGQYLVRKMHDLRRRDARTPILLNIDNTYKPENWYMYHQLSDIPCLDPYYDVGATYSHYPGALGAHFKPTYVYAATTISASSSYPKPMHVILCSARYRDPVTGVEGRFATPEEIRMQVYYALAAGAKGLSYWWYTPAGDCIGCGADEPAARSLYNEIGILGAETRTAGPVTTLSCPVDLPVEASRWLWVKTLISGPDTVAVIVVNDNVLCDRVGTVHKPVDKARVKVKLPEWLKARDCFEISDSGISDADWKQEGGSASFELGTVDISRFIVITSNAGLKKQLTELYAEKFAANTAELLKNRP